MTYQYGLESVEDFARIRSRLFGIAHRTVGRATDAEPALRRIEEQAEASGTDWALGVLARSGWLTPTTGGGRPESWGFRPAVTK